jgi:hypothetical protein
MKKGWMRANPPCMQLSERLDVCLHVLKAQRPEFCLEKAIPIVAWATGSRVERPELFVRTWTIENRAREKDSKAQAVKAGRKLF